jgi:hypothetical protein
MKRKRDRTEELLFACSRAQGPGPRRDEIRALIRRGADLESLRSLAVNHHVSSLVYNALKSYTPSSPAEEKAIKGLRISCLANSAANSFYKKELMRILAAFAEKNIPVIPLKGILLSEYLYGDAESRDRSVDIDLLVKEETLENARSLLERIGYAFKPAGEIEEYLWSYNFIKPGMPAIDLHWDITMMVRSRKRIDSLWYGAQPANADGVEYYYFGPEEQLLYLSAHLVNSGAFRQLRHIRDIERLIERYGNEIDWNSVVRKAREWRLSGSLYAALILVRQSLKAGLLRPHFVQARNDDVKWEMPQDPGISLSKRLFIRFFVGKKVVTGDGFRRRLLDAFLSYTFFEIVEAASLKDYLDIFKRIFFPPREIVGESGYCRRIIRGAVKISNQVRNQSS